jgi:hypothetical protein
MMDRRSFVSNADLREERRDLCSVFATQDSKDGHSFPEMVQKTVLYFESHNEIPFPAPSLKHGRLGHPSRCSEPGQLPRFVSCTGV